MKNLYLIPIYLLFGFLQTFSETPFNPIITGNTKFLLDSILSYEITGFITPDSSITPNDSTYFSLIEMSYFKYSTTNVLIEDLEVYPLGNLSSSFDTKYTYNSNKLKISDSVFYKDNNDIWNLLEMGNYQYNDKNFLDEIYFLSIPFSATLYKTKTSYFYDDYDSLITTLGQYLNLKDTTYYIATKHENIYDSSNHNKLKETTFYYSNNDWVPIGYNKYYYDSKNNLSKIIYYSIESGVSAKQSVDSMVYNDKGFKIEEYKSNFLNDTINNNHYQLYRYIYNDNGNLDSIFYYYKDTNFVLRNISEYYYHQISENIVKTNNLIQNTKIIPNPASDQLNIYYFSNNDFPLSLKVFNSMGVEIQVGNFETTFGENLINLDLTKYSQGLYYITMIKENFIDTKKFVVVK
jgi:hypothetical protein